MKAFFVCVYRNLPAKPEEEAQKHRQEYEEMVAQAKKRGDFLLMFVCICVSTMPKMNTNSMPNADFVTL